MTSQRVDDPAADQEAGTEPTQKAPERRRLTLTTMTLGALALLGLLFIAALAPAAHLAAEKLPLRPDDVTALVEGSVRNGTTALRQLPLGLPTGQRMTSIKMSIPSQWLR